MALKDRKFLEARLATTTKNMRVHQMLGSRETFTIEQTGSDRYPWRLNRVTMVDGAQRNVHSMTSNVNYHGLCAAIDALYELSWNHDCNPLEWPETKMVEATD